MQYYVIKSIDTDKFVFKLLVVAVKTDARVWLKSQDKRSLASYMFVICHYSRFLVCLVFLFDLQWVVFTLLLSVCWVQFGIDSCSHFLLCPFNSVLVTILYDRKFHFSTWVYVYIITSQQVWACFARDLLVSWFSFTEIERYFSVASHIFFKNGCPSFGMLSQE